MKKHFLLFAFVTNIILIITTTSGCPYGFSPDDPRPFFEQYEKEITPQTTDENKKEEEKKL